MEAAKLHEEKKVTEIAELTMEERIRGSLFGLAWVPHCIVILLLMK